MFMHYVRASDVMCCSQEISPGRGAERNIFFVLAKYVNDVIG